MEKIGDDKFHVVQTSGSFRNEIGEMTEMQVYAHVRTRLDDDTEAAEQVIRELEETGEAEARFNDSFGHESRIDIRRVSEPPSDGSLHRLDILRAADGRIA